MVSTMTKDRTYRLLVVGDMVLCAQREAPAFVKALISSFDADCVAGNSEIPLTERGAPAAKFVAWRTSPSVARQIRDLGFDIVSLANNHALDYGREGLEDTRAAFRNVGIQAVGAGQNLDAAFAPATVAFDETTKVAILAVATTLPLGSAAGENRPGVAPIRVSTSYEFDPMDLQEEPGCQPTYIHTHANEQDVDHVCEKIRDWKKKGHVVLVSIHWGNAFQKKLAQYQRPLARAFEQAGCDLVVGHHPHTIHGIEVINRMPALYSLGNFVMDETIVAQAKNGLPEGLATPWTMSCEALVGVAELSEGRLTSLRVHPIVLDEDGFPRKPEQPLAQKILRDVETYPPGPIGWELRNEFALIRVSELQEGPR